MDTVKPQEPVNGREKDVVDWVILAGRASEAEISKRTGLSRPAVAAVIAKYEKSNVLVKKDGLLRASITFNGASEAGKCEKARLAPTVEVSCGEKRFNTKLDVVTRLVERFGEVELSKLSRLFEVRMDVVESWAKILHSQGVASLYYPLAGEPVLVRKGDTPKVLTPAVVAIIIFLLLLLAAVAFRQEILDVLTNAR